MSCRPNVVPCPGPGGAKPASVFCCWRYCGLSKSSHRRALPGRCGARLDGWSRNGGHCRRRLRPPLSMATAGTRHGPPATSTPPGRSPPCGTASGSPDRAANWPRTLLHLSISLVGSRRGYLPPAPRRGRLDEPARLPFIRQPTQILAGSDDPMISLVNARIMARLLRTPHCRCTTTDTWSWSPRTRTGACGHRLPAQLTDWRPPCPRPTRTAPPSRSCSNPHTYAPDPLLL